MNRNLIGLMKGEQIREKLLIGLLGMCQYQEVDKYNEFTLLTNYNL